jgi:formiminotetrahydrofolate cyclodeaminase
LEIRAAREASPRLRELILAAGQHAEQLAHYSTEDAAAYAAYAQARRDRRPQAEIQAALRRAIDTPIAAVRTTLASLELCRESAALLTGPMAADARGAAALLAGVVQAILCTVDVNLLALEGESLARQLRAERLALEKEAVELARRILGQ